jgi:hypothetical protein
MREYWYDRNWYAIFELIAEKKIGFADYER